MISGSEPAVRTDAGRSGLEDHPTVAHGYIDANVLDVVSTAPMGFKVVGELLHDRGLATLTGEDQAWPRRS